MAEETSFPLPLSEFDRKKDALYDGDPNGDYVQAEDINELQESIEKVEFALGINDLKDKVSDELNRKVSKEDVSDFGSPLFIIYNGASINSYNTIEERTNAFSYIPYVMLKKEISSSFEFFTREIKRSGTQLYGIVNCEGSNANLIEADIDWFKSKGFQGVLLSGFGFENGHTRSLQNSILRYVHERNLSAILTGEIETTLFNKPHNSNPLQEDLLLTKDDIYLSQNVFIIDGEKNNPIVVSGEVFNLNKAQQERGIKVFVEDTSDIDEKSLSLYLHGKLLSTLYNLDGYSLAPKSRYALNEKVNKYLHGFELGRWKTSTPVYVENASSTSRPFSKGTIVFDKVKNKVSVEGLGLDPNIYTWQDKQIPGSAVDLVNAEYNNEVVGSLVDAINENNHLIHYSKIDGLNQGGFTPDLIKDSVVRAINNSPAAKAKNPPDGYETLAGNDFIHGGVIDYIDAGSIKSGVLNIEAINTNVIDAINAYIGKAVINSAFVGELSANHIAANVVDAINIYAANASINKAVIDNAVIGQLSTDNLKAAVIEAINVSIENAVIDSAKIGDLTADHIKATVIQAINASIEDAVIDSAKIGTLTASHIKGMVVDAINLYAGQAKIDAAQIGALKAENIAAGLIEALEISASIGEFDSLKAAVIDAINASIEHAFINGAIIESGTINEVQIADASITDAKIVSLVANKIVSGVINTSLVTLEGDNGHLRITGNRLQVFDNQETPVERVSIGDVNKDGSVYGLRVRGADGQTVLYDESGVYSEGITDGAITNPKIAEGAVDGEKHIIANTITGDKIVADSITGREIKAKSISTNELDTNAIVAGSGIIGEAAIGGAEIAQASIDDGHIKRLSVEKLTSGLIQMTSRNIISNSTFRKGLLDWSLDSGLNIGEVSEVVRLNATNSLHLFSTGHSSVKNFGARSKKVEASEGESYAASVYVLTRNLSSYNGGQARVGIEFYNEGTKILSEYQAAELKTLDDWQRIYVISIAPEGTTHVCFRIYHPQNGDTFFSRPMLQKGNIVTEWTGDGSYMTEDGIYTGDLHTNQLTAGKIKANMLQIGPDTEFEPGYSPGELRDEIESRIPYRVEVISTNGTMFRQGQIATTLNATVYKGPQDITDTIPSNRFAWFRVGADGEDDLTWNAEHIGMKSVDITKEDVTERATFLCKVMDT
ncbi:hypothetical protein ABFV99_13060 [Cytobacillus horneckiae]|uniref:hypothetical protein n=1 Tax=Cytobacillus horneckiae TaxID=549687 RepID=UPI0034CEBDB7